LSTPKKNKTQRRIHNKGNTNGEPSEPMLIIIFSNSENLLLSGEINHKPQSENKVVITHIQKCQISPLLIR
jgi:hypothetical protein